MKKLFTMCLCLVLILSFVGCNDANTSDDVSKSNIPTPTANATAKTANKAPTSTTTTTTTTHTHNYTPATCTSPKKCSSCGDTAGSSLGHNYSVATCTSPKKCSRCNETQGSALGHNYSKATCSSPQKCSRCGNEQGKVAEHSYSNWKCIYCGRTDPQKAIKKEAEIAAENKRHQDEMSNIEDIQEIIDDIEYRIQRYRDKMTGSYSASRERSLESQINDVSTQLMFERMNSYGSQTTIRRLESQLESLRDELTELLVNKEYQEQIDSLESDISYYESEYQKQLSKENALHSQNIAAINNKYK